MAEKKTSKVMQEKDMQKGLGVLPFLRYQTISLKPGETLSLKMES